MKKNELEYVKNVIHRIESTFEIELEVNQTQVGEWSFYNIFNAKNTQALISEKVYTGFHKSPAIALMKALSEFVERAAFSLGHANGDSACCTEFSDGFAAYPNLTNLDTALFMARQNALNEAIERFVWAKWWDEMTCAQISNLDSIMLNEYSTLVEVIDNHTPIEKIYLISPVFENYSSSSLLIMYIKIINAGYISAGAAYVNGQINSALERSFAEMIRHSMAYYRHRTQNISPQSQYEKRLCYFASGDGSLLVENRLKRVELSQRKISLPKLAIDCRINHPLDDLVTVHRCYFENQPNFLGGKLERLCL